MSSKHRMTEGMHGSDPRVAVKVKKDPLRPPKLKGCCAPRQGAIQKLASHLCLSPGGPCPVLPGRGARGAGAGLRGRTLPQTEASEHRAPAARARSLRCGPRAGAAVLSARSCLSAAFLSSQQRENPPHPLPAGWSGEDTTGPGGAPRPGRRGTPSALPAPHKRKSAVVSLWGEGLLPSLPRYCHLRHLKLSSRLLWAGVQCDPCHNP